MADRNDDLDHSQVRLNKRLAKQEFGRLLQHLRDLPGTERARLQSQFAQTLVNETFEVDTPRGRLAFVLLGQTAAGRAATLLTKQPATIEWIDSFRPDSVFWDVGANVGLYTLYAASRGDTRVVAVEPAAVNYYLLTANCEANGFHDQVDCLLVGLSSDRGLARLEVSQFAPALSFSFRGKPDRPQPSRQAALLLSMDQLIEEYGLECPNYIKIDVPGLTEAIIEGSARTLRRTEVREVHIELSEHSKGGRRIVEMLERCGLVVASRHTRGGTADLTLAKPENRPSASGPLA